jgi:hypothetical protein
MYLAGGHTIGRAYDYFCVSPSRQRKSRQISCAIAKSNHDYLLDALKNLPRPVKVRRLVTCFVNYNDAL